MFCLPHSLPPYAVSSMVALVVVGTALAVGSCIAFHLLDTSRLAVEVVADILAPSEKEIGAVRMREVELVYSSANASQAKRLLL